MLKLLEQIEAKQTGRAMADAFRAALVTRPNGPIGDG